MKVTVVGCSPAWPNPGGAQSGYLVESGRRLLLDCGPGVLARLREREAWPHVDAIVITHFHLDHWGDLVPWAFGVMVGPAAGDGRAELWVPPDGRERMREFGRLFGFEQMFEEVFDLHEYEPDTSFAAAGFEVTPFRMAHYNTHTFGMRIVDGDATLAYSGDSGPSRQLAELARDADLFLCEATLAEPEDGLRGHLTADEALAAYRDSGARRLVVVHRPHELALGEDVERAFDGLELTL